MTNTPRYRYASFAEKSPVYFVDSEAARAQLVNKGAIAFSVHSYSRPLEHEPRPKRIWGDLHLWFAMPDGTSSSERLSSLYSLLAVNNIPRQSVSAYNIDNGVEVIIDEHTFRGEIGSPCRFDFDKAIQRRAEADSLTYLTVNNVRVPMSQIPAAMVKAPVALERNRHPLFASYAQSKSTNVVTTLARTYYAYHYRLKGLQDYMVPKLAYAANCSIFNTLIKKREASIDELAIICDLFGGVAEYFTQLLDIHGRQILLNNVSYMELKTARAGLASKIECGNVEKALAHIDKTYICHRRCGVSTPQAFPFTAGQDCPAGLVREDEIFSLRPTGLYAFHPEQDRWIRIMDPIWVNRIMPDTQNGLGAREIICHNIEGFPIQLIISQKDFDSTTFFSILQYNRVHVPKDNGMKGQLRAFLASQYPHHSSTDQTTMVTQAGWQHRFQYTPPTTKLSRSAPYKAKANILPIPYDVQDSINSVPKTQHSACSSLLLGALASMAAPALAMVKTPGICLHFHGGSQTARNALLASISRVSGHAIYLLPDALKHMAALKRHHKDSTLHIGEVGNDDIKGMHRLIRRYFLGRKGKDGPTAGIIISTGSKPLGQKSSRLFTHKKRVLAIDVELPENFTANDVELPAQQHAIIEALTEQQDATLTALKTERKAFSSKSLRAKDTLDKQVSAFFWLCASVGSWAERCEKLSWWRGDTLSKIFVKTVSDYSQQVRFTTALNRLSLIIPTNAKIGDIPIRQLGEMEEIAKDNILIPTAQMNESTPPGNTLRQWTAWLLENKILIPKKKGILSGVYYSKKQRCELRGYLISRRALFKVLSRTSNHN